MPYDYLLILLYSLNKMLQVVSSYRYIYILLLIISFALSSRINEPDAMALIKYLNKAGVTYYNDCVVIEDYVNQLKFSDIRLFTEIVPGLMTDFISVKTMHYINDDYDIWVDMINAYIKEGYINIIKAVNINYEKNFMIKCKTQYEEIISLFNKYQHLWCNIEMKYLTLLNSASFQNDYKLRETISNKIKNCPPIFPIDE